MLFYLLSLLLLYKLYLTMYMFVFGAARKPAPLDIGRKAIFIVLYLNMHIIEINAKPPEDTDGHEHSLLYKIPAV